MLLSGKASLGNAGVPLFVFAVTLLVSCGSGSGAGDAQDPTAKFEITAVAGPVCPAETDPPSPECAAQPVENAVIIIETADADEIARGTTNADGVVTIDVAPRELSIVPQPVEGYMGTAGSVTVTALDGQTVQVVVDYDTGIR